MKEFINYLLLKNTNQYFFIFLFVNVFFWGSSTTEAKKITVSTAAQFKSAVTSLMPGDTLEVLDGTYDLNAYFNLTQSGIDSLPIVIRSKNIGGAVFINKSLFDLKQVSYLIFEGFDIRSKDGTAIKMESCNYVRITRNFFRLTETTSQKWILVGGTYDKPNLTSSHNRFDHNLFENKSQPGNFITIDGTPSPTYLPSQYDLIDHNYFKNSSPRVTNEKEAVRLGQSNFSAASGYTTVEYNLFEDCDGDPEFVSVKMCDDTVRYNTFLNSMGTLCLRQGKRSVAYGNFFIGNNKEGTGGVRIYSSDHKVYNNYMENLTGDTWDAPITITNGDAENSSTTMSAHFRSENVFIGFNTIINCTHGIQMGFTNNGSYSKPPRNITFTNNLVTGKNNELVKIFTAPVNNTWLSNIMYPVDSAVIGIQVAETGIKNINPLLIANNGLMKLSDKSPLINSAKGGYGFITNDIDGQLRDSLPDIGADEYSKGIIINRPLTANDVGPFADNKPLDVKNNHNTLPSSIEFAQNYPNPFNPSTILKFRIDKGCNVKLIIFDILGRNIACLVDEYKQAGEYSILFSAENYKLASGIYFCQLVAGNKTLNRKMVFSK